jgi:uncharacterized protein (TIGR02001 family)
MRKSIPALAVAAALALPPALAAAQSSPHSVTGNVGFFSQYIFRGLKQTDGKPALQGGFDYAHSSGFYAGTWASNVSWLSDSPGITGYTSSSLEWDFYGGYKGSLGDFGYDVGLLYYWYPGRVAPGFFDADTLEVYGAVSWKWLTAKLSWSLGDETFGVPDSDGTYYLDLTASFPVTDKLAIQAHYGIQEFSGDTGGVDNDAFASYKDWKLGVTYALPQSFTLGAFYSDTDMNSTQEAFYTNAAGRFLGKETFTVFVQKTF